MTLHGHALPRHALLRLVGAAAVALLVIGCGGSATDAGSSPAPPTMSGAGSGPEVTFLELGSQGCVPCEQMRPVMAGIETAFGEQVEVIFYDVREDDAPAKQYGVQYIPTQVFLDENGEEFHRHVGFYPREEIEAMLVEHGLEKLTSQ